MSRQSEDSRQLRLSLAEEQLRTQTAEIALRTLQKAGDASNADIIRSLRSELKSQEAAIIEANKIRKRVK